MEYLYWLQSAEMERLSRALRARDPDRFLEVWPDFFDPAHYWLDGALRAELDPSLGAFSVRARVAGDRVPVFLRPHIPADEPALPTATSLRLRTLAGHGVGVAVVDREGEGEAQRHVPAGVRDAFFYLMRPRGGRNYLWRLFRSRDDAEHYLRHHAGYGPEVSAWAAALGDDPFRALLASP
jgi:hypothetical protein